MEVSHAVKTHITKSLEKEIRSPHTVCAFYYNSIPSLSCLDMDKYNIPELFENIHCSVNKLCNIIKHLAFTSLRSKCNRHPGIFLIYLNDECLVSKSRHKSYHTHVACLIDKVLNSMENSLQFLEIHEHHIKSST